MLFTLLHKSKIQSVKIAEVLWPNPKCKMNWYYENLLNHNLSNLRFVKNSACGITFCTKISVYRITFLRNSLFVKSKNDIFSKFKLSRTIDFFGQKIIWRILNSEKISFDLWIWRTEFLTNHGFSELWFGGFLLYQKTDG